MVFSQKKKGTRILLGRFPFPGSFSSSFFFLRVAGGQQALPSTFFFPLGFTLFFFFLPSAERESNQGHSAKLTTVGGLNKVKRGAFCPARFFSFSFFFWTSLSTFKFGRQKHETIFSCSSGPPPRNFSPLIVQHRKTFVKYGQKPPARFSLGNFFPPYSPCRPQSNGRRG